MGFVFEESVQVVEVVSVLLAQVSLSRLRTEEMSVPKELVAIHLLLLVVFHEVQRRHRRQAEIVE